MILGLTGGIAAGKSTLTKLFKEHGIPVIDADHVVHDAQKVGGIGYQPTLDIVGEDCLNPDGSFNRTAIRDKVLQSPEVMDQLEQVLHPLVHAHYAEELQKHQDEPLVVLDVPLLFNSPTEKLCDQILVADCPLDIRKERAFARGHMTDEWWDFIVSRQLSDAEYRARADSVIDTTQSLDQVEVDLEHVLALLPNTER